MEAIISAGFCGKTKESPDGRIKMRPRGSSPVWTQKQPIE